MESAYTKEFPGFRKPHWSIWGLKCITSATYSEMVKKKIHGCVHTYTHKENREKGRDKM